MSNKVKVLGYDPKGELYPEMQELVEQAYDKVHTNESEETKPDTPAEKIPDTEKLKTISRFLRGEFTS